jgi:hypothetical protein
MPVVQGLEFLGQTSGFLLEPFPEAVNFRLKLGKDCLAPEGSTRGAHGQREERQAYG